MREAVILAGGLASRLGDIAATVPKSLLPAAGRPFIDHLAWNLRRHGIERIVVAAGRLGEQLAEHVGDGSAWGVSAKVVVEPEPLGTGGAAALAARELEGDEFLLLNGDTLLDLNYLDLALARRAAGVPLAMALREVADTARYGAVTLAADGRVSAFAEKDREGAGLINGGVYAMTRDVFAGRDGAFSLERDVVPTLVEQGAVAGAVYPGAFVDIGVPDAYASANAEVAAWRDKPLVLLDRDGVLNVDHGWVHTPAEWEWVPGAIAGVKAINDAGALAVVVTNQAGIARGLYTEAEYLAFERWIADRLAEHGAHLDAVYHCPHHPELGATELTRECDCRKPAPGMLLDAMRDFGADPARAVFIGDTDGDMAAAAAAGIAGVRYVGGDVATVVREVLPCA
ncbi:MAG: HAD-IIIA family hydrolase [Coriobacteriia bacterium]|nr:HAD-IIIA family hydrolase [Coriobacteriia bacterium]